MSLEAFLLQWQQTCINSEAQLSTGALSSSAAASIFRALHALHRAARCLLFTGAVIIRQLISGYRRTGP